MCGDVEFWFQSDKYTVTRALVQEDSLKWLSVEELFVNGEMRVDCEVKSCKWPFQRVPQELSSHLFKLAKFQEKNFRKRHTFQNMLPLLSPKGSTHFYSRKYYYVKKQSTSKLSFKFGRDTQYKFIVRWRCFYIAFGVRNYISIDRRFK